MPSFLGNGGRYQADSELWTADATWANAVAYTGGGISADGYTMPRYYLEYVTEVDNSGDDSEKFGAASEDLPGMYRVNSRGESQNGRSVVILRTTFIK